MEYPLVTVICLCYNQAPYVSAALASILGQTYSNLEIIVCDDASDDKSSEKILAFIQSKPNIIFIQNETRLGNCKAFNKALAAAKGDFIIDLAADDVLLPTRVFEGIEAFSKKNDSYGIHYCMTNLINESGTIIENEKYKYHEGDIYSLLIRKYFVNPVTMMIRRNVLQQLNGYDEKLSYEDFDFWIRSSRFSKYCFTPKVLVHKRIVPNSLSTQQLTWRNSHQKSTLIVCEKILILNRNRSEDHALRTRIYYEMFQCLKYGNINLIFRYLLLYLKSFRTFPEV